MSIGDYLSNHAEKKRAEEAAAQHEREQEELRVALNRRRLTANLREVVLPQLEKARDEIKANGFHAEIIHSISSDGIVSFAIILRTSGVKGISDEGKHRLEYNADERTAIITARIAFPSPTMRPFHALDLYPIDTITGEIVDSHIMQFVKIVFP